MKSRFEKPNTFFRKHTGQEIEVDIVNQELLTAGRFFADVSESNVEIGGRKRKFIIKRYHQPGMAQAAFEKYSIAKKAGLKVFPTFRIGEDGRSILMTTGFLNDQICIDSNSRISLKDLGYPLIEDIGNLQQFLLNFFDEGLKAGKQGVLTLFDIFFFILNKENPPKADFVIGDLDNLAQMKISKNLILANIESIREVLFRFCERNIHPKFKKRFLGMVDSYYQQALKKASTNE